MVKIQFIYIIRDKNKIIITIYWTKQIDEVSSNCRNKYLCGKINFSNISMTNSFRQSSGGI